MRHATRPVASLAPAAASILLLTLLFAPRAFPETIFKCTSADGTDLYSNFPCESQSGSVALQQDTAPSAPESPPPSADPSPDAPQAAPTVGMTAADVRAIWGAPASVVREEVVEGRTERWSYSASRSVQFDHSGHVTAVEP